MRPRELKELGMFAIRRGRGASGWGSREREAELTYLGKDELDEEYFPPSKSKSNQAP